MDKIQAKNLVIEAGKALVEGGLIARTWGNVSCRIDQDTFVITPSGRDYMSLVPEEIVEVNIETLAYEGDVKPSSEKGAHAEVYKAKPDANFVIHTHQTYASVISASGLNEIAVDDAYPSLNGKVLVTGYGLPSTKKLAGEIAKAVKASSGQAIILKNHGALCFGADYDSAFEAAEALEAACLSYLNKKAGVSVKDEDALWQAISKRIQASKDIGRKDVKAVVDIIKTLKEQYPHLHVADDSACLVAAAIGKAVKPFVDDFAQIIGLKMPVVSLDQSAISKAFKKSNAVLVEGIGALCIGRNDMDAGAVQMIASKTAKAHLAGYLFNEPKPINMLESKLMNVIYQRKYAKQI